jgi:hypothetical protein
LNAKMAFATTKFTATDATDVTSVVVRSTDTVVFRCWPQRPSKRWAAPPGPAEGGRGAFQACFCAPAAAGRLSSKVSVV